MPFEVIPESITGHCCFVASVVDAEKYTKRGAIGVVCECFDPDDAKLICEALNERTH